MNFDVIANVAATFPTAAVIIARYSLARRRVVARAVCGECHGKPAGVGARMNAGTDACPACEGYQSSSSERVVRA